MAKIFITLQEKEYRTLMTPYKILKEVGGVVKYVDFDSDDPDEIEDAYNELNLEYPAGRLSLYNQINYYHKLTIGSKEPDEPEDVKDPEEPEYPNELEESENPEEPDPDIDPEDVEYPEPEDPEDPGGIN